MSKLRTDDDIYRARLVYLGPPGYTLPFQWTYQQYLVGAALCAGFALAAWLLTGSGTVVAWAFGAAFPVTALVFRYVDPDRPAWQVLRTALTDWRFTAPPADEPTPLPRLSAGNVRIGEGP